MYQHPDEECLQELNAPAPFVRRMWAGGSQSWNHKIAPLRIGDRIAQATKVVKVEYKKGMVFVHQQRDLYHFEDGGEHMLNQEEGRWAIRELRTHVFRPAGVETVQARESEC